MAQKLLRLERREECRFPETQRVQEAHRLLVQQESGGPMTVAPTVAFEERLLRPFLLYRG